MLLMVAALSTWCWAADLEVMEAASTVLGGQVRVYSCERMRLTYAPSTRRAQPQVRFRSEADMNRQARLVGPVENDPKQTWQVQCSVLGNLAGFSPERRHYALPSGFRSMSRTLCDLGCADRHDQSIAKRR
jgi:hypothetical protein